MKQIVINVPEDKYQEFLNHIKEKFSDIQISKTDEDIKNYELSDAYESMLLSEKSLAEEWLSDKDNRWDDLL